MEGLRKKEGIFKKGYCVGPFHILNRQGFPQWAIFGKQNWRCGMNRTLGRGAQAYAHRTPVKGVGPSGQQDGGHGSRNPLRSV